MKQFRKILVWVEETDEGRSALDRAIVVARETGAALTLMHVLERPGRVFCALYHQAKELHSVLLREWKDRLEAFASPLRAEGIEASVLVLEGKPCIAAVREVLRSGHDLLLKPAEGTRDGPFFGSTDLHLLRKCPCAVWICRPGAPPAIRILATVDPEPRDCELNRRILEVAASLAEMRGATLDVLHVWQPFAADLLAKRVSEEELEKYVADARRCAKQELDRLLETVDPNIPENHVHLIRGDAIRAIPEYVLRHDIGLIVMGTVCRVGVPGFVIGNTAEGVLARVRSSVLTLKPEGFVSPIKLEVA